MNIFKKLFLESSGEVVRRFSQKNIILREIKNFRGKNLLYDAGCGAGLYTLSVAAFFNKVVALDLFDKHVKLVKKNLDKNNITNVEVYQGDVERFILKKKADFILSSEVLEHLYNPNKCLKTFYKNLSKDGCILISVPFSNESALNRSLKYSYSKNKLNELHKIKGYNKENLSKLIQKNNFKIIKIFYPMGIFAKIAINLVNLHIPNVFLIPLALLDYLTPQFIKKLVPEDIAIIGKK